METTCPQVIDLASFISGGEDEGKKKLTSTVEKNHNWAVSGVCCFAGANDELVVAASLLDDLHFWSVPEGGSAVNQQIMHLKFADDDQQIIGVFYSKPGLLNPVARWCKVVLITLRYGRLSNCFKQLPTDRSLATTSRVTIDQILAHVNAPEERQKLFYAYLRPIKLLTTT